MINVKDEVYAALLSVTDNVTDSYPKDWEKDLAIQYMISIHTALAGCDEMGQDYCQDCGEPLEWVEDFYEKESRQ